MTPVMTLTLVDAIDALLPQTQCTRCSYPSCRDYAKAIADGAAGIDQCPPGGDSGVVALATLLDRPQRSLHPDFLPAMPAQVAVIDEATCIGCAKCIEACPVDAILGARKWMHTVIVDWCTGCELCIAPCPVDCITLEKGEGYPPAALSRTRFVQRNDRRERENAMRAARLEALVQ
jgi:Na+-translocating ferredoxin:NAD+ oxidoreductase subunit B